MRSCAEQEEFENVCVNAVDEQPVRLDVTLAKTAVVPCKGMVTVLWCKSFLRGENVQYTMEAVEVSAASAGDSDRGF